MIQPLWLPGFFPVSINVIGRHWRIASRWKNHAVDVVIGAVLVHGAGVAKCKRRVDLHLILPAGQRRIDRSNAWKGLLDVLVRCGLLVDDSPTWCVEGAVTYSRAMDELTGTLVLLEDLP